MGWPYKFPIFSIGNFLSFKLPNDMHKDLVKLLEAADACAFAHAKDVELKSSVADLATALEKLGRTFEGRAK